MIDVVKILQNEVDNDELIYLYRDGEHWYAYERSAFFLSQMMQGYVKLARFEVDNVLWLARAEVDINKLPTEHLVCFGADASILRYIANYTFHNWLSDITCDPA